ncbi:hypothetical protein [Lactovum odontotermitis]
MEMNGQVISATKKNRFLIIFLLLLVVIVSCTFLYFRADIYFPKETKTFVVHDNGAISLTVGVAKSQKNNIQIKVYDDKGKLIMPEKQSYSKASAAYMDYVSTKSGYYYHYDYDVIDNHDKLTIVLQNKTENLLVSSGRIYRYYAEESQYLWLNAYEK